MRVAYVRIYPRREKNIRSYHQFSLEESLLSLGGSTKGRDEAKEGFRG